MKLLMRISVSASNVCQESCKRLTAQRVMSEPKQTVEPLHKCFFHQLFHCPYDSQAWRSYQWHHHGGRIMEVSCLAEHAGLASVQMVGLEKWFPVLLNTLVWHQSRWLDWRRVVFPLFLLIYWCDWYHVLPVVSRLWCVKCLSWLDLWN